MREQELPEAGIWEKLGVKTLFWLEKHLEAKPETEVDRLKRRRIVKALGLATAAVVIAGSGISAGLLLRPRLTPLLEDLLVSDELPIVPNLEPGTDLQDDYFGDKWQSHQDVTRALRKVEKDKDLILLIPNPIRYKVLDKIIFYQTCRGAILGINQETLIGWLSQTGKLDNFLAFILNDTMDPTAEVTGADGLKIPLDTRFRQIKGSSKKELAENLAIDISSAVTLTYQYVRSFGSTRALQILGSSPGSDDYQTAQNGLSFWGGQFRQGRIKPFIKVIAINPFWVKEKLSQSQRP